jgi:hypothetical protein
VHLKVDSPNFGLLATGELILRAVKRLDSRNALRDGKDRQRTRFRLYRRGKPVYGVSYDQGVLWQQSLQVSVHRHQVCAGQGSG